MAKSSKPSKSKSKSPTSKSAGKAAEGVDVLERIATALERLAPRQAAAPDYAAADA